MDPSALYLMEKIHLHPTIFFPLGSATSAHVLFFCKASNSSFIAFVQFVSNRASSMLLGILHEDSVCVFLHYPFLRKIKPGVVPANLEIPFN